MTCDIALRRRQTVKERGWVGGFKVLLWVLLGLSVLVGLASPFGSRLQATSLWAGRALVPQQALSASGPQGLQSALNEGWPSWIGFATGIVPFLLAGLGLIYSWWAPIVVLATAMIVSSIAGHTTLAPVNVDRYLMLLLQNLQRRKADYVRSGDTDRAEAAQELADELERLVHLYMDSGIPAPDVKQAKEAPFGDYRYLFNLREGE